jgi:hypothetical protein
MAWEFVNVAIAESIKAKAGLWPSDNLQKLLVVFGGVTSLTIRQSPLGVNWLPGEHITKNKIV